MRVEVDPDLCQGHARCWALCPEVFDVDDDGYAVVQLQEIPPALQDAVREAEANCPEQAIRLA